MCFNRWVTSCAVCSYIFAFTQCIQAVYLIHLYVPWESKTWPWKSVRKICTYIDQFCYLPWDQKAWLAWRFLFVWVLSFWEIQLTAVTLCWCLLCHIYSCNHMILPFLFMSNFYGHCFCMRVKNMSSNFR